MKQEQITLRCKDGQEAVVFTKYTFKTLVTNHSGKEFINEDINYEISIEDSYIGGNYKGFFGRIKRAWKAFWDKPVVYTGIYCEYKSKMRKFLIDCLDLMNECFDLKQWEYIGDDDNDMPMYKCPMCGRKQFGRSKYCSSCGNRLIWEDENES